MKKIITTVLLFSMLLSLVSCSNDDSEPDSIQDTSAEISFAENPEVGAAIDTISNRVQNASGFSLVLQSHKNAFTIDAVSGIVAVNDPLVFDFETNPLVTAVIAYQAGNETREFELKVRLENKDDVLHFLTTSQGLYELARAGDWIKITEEEYATLETNLSEIYYCGTTKEQYDEQIAGLPDEWHSGSFTVANNNGANIPEGSYLFAFKYDFIPHASKIIIDDTQLKISTTAVDSGYEDFAAPLPLHTYDDAFFLLKGSDSAMPQEAFLGMYKDTYVWTNSQFITEEYYYGAGNVSDLDGFIRNQKSFKYQGLATTIKQWE